MTSTQSNPTTSPSSVLIIGAGIFGASTAYHLSLTHPNPSRITILDRTPFPPTVTRSGNLPATQSAASTDINKIIRADYTDPFYMTLAYEAIHAWETWPELKRFYYRTGWVMCDPEGSDLAERIRANFKAGVGGGQDPTSDVSLEEVRRRWGGILREAELGEGWKGAYWNPLAGWCEAGDATAEMVKVAVGRGVRYVQGEVGELVLGEEGVRGVKTKDGRLFEAEKVVLATGAWASALMTGVEDELGVAEDDRVEKQAKAAGVCVAHYRLDDKEMQELTDMPVIVYGEHGEVLPPPGRNRLLKYTNANTFTNTTRTKSGRQISVPPMRDQTIVPKKLQQETMDLIIDKTMPHFTRNKPVDYWRLCWDSITPTQQQLMTRHPHPRLSNLYLAVGGSFHSYKFLPIIGKYMVNVLEGRSNGEEKDEAWRWKTETHGGRGAHEKVIPKRELRDLEEEREGARARL